MTKHIRFSIDPNAVPTVPDSDPTVRYGVVENDTVFATEPFSTTRTGASHPLAEVRLLPPCLQSITRVFSSLHISLFGAWCG